ncbi:MAG TPA: glycosyltransferase [Ignavibacteria bacterium]
MNFSLYTIYNLLITAILFVLFLICLWNLYILRKKSYTKIPDSSLPFVSVLIPARNEEVNINKILPSVLEQEYPGYEVIVLNDNSDDRTGEIIEQIKKKYPQLKVINGKPLEEGWTGKCFACKQLYEESKGDYLLFTDADTVHRPNSLRDSVTIALNTNADMLTLFPKMTMISLAEKIIMPMFFFVVMLLLPLYFVEKKGFVNFSIGMGPFIMFKRKAYDKIGTHEAVKNAIVEDIWLARKIKKHGLKLTAADGMSMVSVRMYSSFKEIWEGLSKNMFAAFKFSSPMLLTVNVIFVLLFFFPFILLPLELSLQFTLSEEVILTLIQVLILYLVRFSLSYRFKLGFISSILHPLGAVSIAFIAFNSWRWIKFGGGSKWKGRVYKPDCSIAWRGGSQAGIILLNEKVF